MKDIIQILDNMEAGMPLIVTTKWQDIIIRKPSLYAGKDETGKYHFIDDTGLYACTPGYLRDHITIETEINFVADLCEIADLCEKVKEGK